MTLWLNFGPSLSPMLALQNDVTGLRASPLLRVGLFAGLPVQFEATLSSSFDPDGFLMNASGGVRLLPVNVSPDGLAMGGGVGHNLGVIAGMKPGGWYAGAVYEWLVVRELGVVAELQWNFGGILREPPSFHLGAKFQFPAFDDGDLASNH